MCHARSSASTFCEKVVPSVASRDLTAAMRSAASPSSRAPARTKPRCVSMSTRASSGESLKTSRPAHNASMRANSALLAVTSDP
jgi:hypothetical protein